MEILFEDKDIIVVTKPSGVASQSTGGFDADMVSLIKTHLSSGGPEPYVGVVHRLDTMVPGVMVYAKTKEAAAALSEQVRKGRMQKTYQAIVLGLPKEKKGEMKDYLVKDETSNLSRVADKKTKGAKEAILQYKVLESRYLNGQQKAKLEIRLITGRHHQIRVQLSSRGMPVEGDVKYGSPATGSPLALAATELQFIHPRNKKEMKYRYDWNRDIS